MKPLLVNSISEYNANGIFTGIVLQQNCNYSENAKADVVHSNTVYKNSPTKDVWKYQVYNCSRCLTHFPTADSLTLHQERFNCKIDDKEVDHELADLLETLYGSDDAISPTTDLNDLKDKPENQDKVEIHDPNCEPKIYLSTNIFDSLDWNEHGEVSIENYEIKKEMKIVDFKSCHNGIQSCQHCHSIQEVIPKIENNIEVPIPRSNFKLTKHLEPETQLNLRHINNPPETKSMFEYPPRLNSNMQVNTETETERKMQFDFRAKNINQPPADFSSIAVAESLPNPSRAAHVDTNSKFFPQMAVEALIPPAPNYYESYSPVSVLDSNNNIIVIDNVTSTDDVIEIEIESQSSSSTESLPPLLVQEIPHTPLDLIDCNCNYTFSLVTNEQVKSDPKVPSKKTRHLSAPQNMKKVKEDDGRTKYRCTICHKLLSSCSAACRHAHFHDSQKEQKPFHCRFCEKKFPRKDSLKFHEHIHTDTKTFGCNLCTRRFRWPAALSKHVSSVHNNVRHFPNATNKASNRKRQNKNAKQHVIQPKFCEMAMQPIPILAK